jgi:hypothetical protein
VGATAACGISQAAVPRRPETYRLSERRLALLDMASSPNELRDMAAECRRLAAAANKEAVREQLLDVAEQFERLAQERQADEMRLHWTSGTSRSPGAF